MASTEGSGDERTPIMLPARRVPARTRGWARSAQRGGTQTGAISLLAALRDAGGSAPHLVVAPVSVRLGLGRKASVWS